MKKLKIGLVARIIIAMLLGFLLGRVLPLSVTRVFSTFNGLFSQFLGFIIPLLIVGLVAPAIADIGRKAGRMLLATTLLAYVATIISGFASYFTSAGIFPELIEAGTLTSSLAKGNDAAPYFVIEIAPLMGVMTALILAFILGLGMAHVNGSALHSVFNDFREIIYRTIAKVIIPLLPLFIFGIALNMSYSGQAAAVLTVFIKIIGVIFVLHIAVLLFQYCVAGLISKRNPLPLLFRMLPAYFTALGTQSSAATIPVTLRQTVANGVNQDVAGFVIPLCATIHLSGSTLKIVACAIAIMMMQGTPVEFSHIAGFILMLGVVMVAAPGVPGGAIMAALGVLQSMLGFGEQEQALMIALYIAMDNFGTACNVTGDGALALIINKFYKTA
ncbi:MAG: dicarboxylate/amino acid:cation symporter [Akkermansia sp.]|nr:dicarboxylate/amino acid:cation symporter [Akkermansia sp.]MBR6576577.1 dicarboxylate/amino acid:cation symporter [Akkermansia sp.]